jgi:hypothetical protein
MLESMIRFETVRQALRKRLLGNKSISFYSIVFLFFLFDWTGVPHACVNTTYDYGSPLYYYSAISAHRARPVVG